LYFWNENKYYVGDWKDNNITGFGIFLNKDNKYIGHYFNNKKHGYGIFLFNDNTKLIGNLVEGHLVGLSLKYDNEDTEQLEIHRKYLQKEIKQNQREINKIKNTSNYIKLKDFYEEMKGRGLVNLDTINFN